MIERALVSAAVGVLWLLRLVFSRSRRTYVVLNTGPVQPVLAAIGRLRARAVFLKGRVRCPAYRSFLEEQGFEGRGRWDLEGVPVTTKENYVKRYGVAQRCYDGAIPASGVVIDESSGSSGVPNNWVRSAAERRDVKRILMITYDMVYHERGFVLLNCFALGPWATGMNVSMSFVDVGIMKSIGPDQKKLENTLSLFGPGYRYLIFGYPPFIKSFVDTTTMDLSAYHMDLVVGGEGISEGLRAHLLKTFRRVVSSYGASDLEINIGAETDMTVELRRRCVADRSLSRDLFGSDAPPMIFQYNPASYVIESLPPDNELVFTIGRLRGAAPKIRYNLKDQGGVMTRRELARRLAARGIDIDTLAPRSSRFPILFVFGRADLTVPFYGAKVYPADVEGIINGHPVLVTQINSFQIVSYEDERIDRRLRIHLEKSKDFRGELLPGPALRDLFFDGLAACNQDFREVAKMFDRSRVEIEVHDFGQGPFRDRDIRVKSRYVA